MQFDPEAFVFLPEAGRFELPLEGIDEPATSTFQLLDAHTLNVIHTEVPLAAQGKGVGSFMVESVIKYALAHRFRVIPTCPVLARFIKRHPEYRPVLAPIKT